MGIIENRTMDRERELYGLTDAVVRGCRFAGPADGESALKESRNIRVEDCVFELRYPLWHDLHLSLFRSEMTETCRAALWYCDDVSVVDSDLFGIKALRECSNVSIRDCRIRSSEFGWSVRGAVIRDTDIAGEYCFLRGEEISAQNMTLDGKYSFQYIRNSRFENCVLQTKDAFWHSENVYVKDSIVNGEYLGWYSKNLTLENCRIRGTQPLCYCESLRLIGCTMEDADYAFERSDVQAEVLSPVVSIRVPRSGFVSAPAVGEIIRDDPEARAEICIR